jgi:hypothetical protein
MVIKFKCPHCHKALSVKEHLAGKRAPCPACKKVLVIPAPQAAPADLEEFAARALADEPQAAAVPAGTIDFTCPYCDEALHLPANLGGKQTPCPECRRIIKVPMPAKKDVANWRQVEAGPSLARRDAEPAPEGAWDSPARARTVSREALEEADAIVEEREPLTLAQKVRRGAYAGCAVLAVAVGWLVLRSYWTRTLQAQALDQARAVVDDKAKKVSPEWAGAVYRGMGEYELRAGKAEDAANRLKKARALARAAGSNSADRDALLLEIAMTQVNLAAGVGMPPGSDRLPWADAATQWRQTLAMISSPEARLAAVREVSRKLIARKQWPLAAELARWLRDSLQPAAPAPRARAEPKDQKAPVSAQPAALLVALHRPDKAGVLIPPPPEAKKKDAKKPKDKDEKDRPKADLVTRLIHEEGWAGRHQLSEARAFFVKAKGHARERLECLLTVAAAASDADQPGEAGACVEDALRLVGSLPKDEPAPAWTLLGFARLAVHLGKDAAAKTFTDALREPSLKAWVQLERYRLEAAKAENLPDESWRGAVPDKKALAHGLAFEAFTRLRARRGGGSELLEAVEKADPPDVRPLGYVGVALGVQDRGKE